MSDQHITYEWMVIEVDMSTEPGEEGESHYFSEDKIDDALAICREITDEGLHTDLALRRHDAEYGPDAAFVYAYTDDKLELPPKFEDTDIDVPERFHKALKAADLRYRGVS